MLLGINESGKNNILEAIALLDKSRKFDYTRDCHSKNEDDKKNIEILYEFEIGKTFDTYKNRFSISKMPKKLADLIDITRICRNIIMEPDGRFDYIHVWIKDKKKEFEKYVIVTRPVKLKDGTEKDVKRIEEKTLDNTQVDANGREENILNKQSFESFLNRKYQRLSFGSTKISI